MKKIIATSILSLLMLLGVGSASAVGDAHIWYFDNKILDDTPVEDCIKAAKKGLLMHEEVYAEGISIEKYYIYDDRLYFLDFFRQPKQPIRIFCVSNSPTRVIK